MEGKIIDIHNVITQRKIKIADKLYLISKRCFDVVASMILGIVLFIPMNLIALAIKLDSEGPVIFKQERVGKNKKIFYIYKFRTMKINAPCAVATRHFTDSEKYITRVGKILRNTSLDELPQIFNILKGEMSFVGYRPVVPNETELNSRRTEYGVFDIKPGLTGLAQISGRDNIGFDEKAKIDAEYVERMSFSMDMKCLFKTVKVVITGEGVR